MKFRRGAWAALLMAVLTACSTNPMTGRSQLSLMPEATVISQSRSAYKAELAPYAKKNRLNDDPDMAARVRAITDRLIAQAVRYRPDTAAWAWEVNVIDDPKTLNAFCLPGGKMAVYSGLILKLKATDDEIAQVMGHEIGHALANHGAEKMSVGMLSDILVAALAGNNRGRQQTGDIASLLLWQLPNSRGAETEADRIGIELAARAGYRPEAAAELWRKMMRESGEKGRFALLSTHPASAERVEALAGLVPAMQPLYTEAAANPQALPTRLAANVRDVTPGAAPPPAALQPLSLVNLPLAAFRRGQARLGCDSCGMSFSSRLGRLKELADRQDWENLAGEVLEADYNQDIAWYYLGLAAEGLGLPVAWSYFERSVLRGVEEGGHCKGGLMDLCNGIDLPQKAREALVRLGP
ncbi:MAG: M48 family metallopeptidase [Pseudomonadota bacterium]